MTGGTLTFPAGEKIVVAGGASSTGTLNQTGGTISGIAAGVMLPIASGANSSGTVTLGGSSSITCDLSVASAPGSVGALTFTGDSRWSLATPGPIYVGSESNAVGALTVGGNALFSMQSTVINPATRELYFGTSPCGTGLVEVAGNGVITNARSLFAGVEGFGSLTLTETGKVYCAYVYAGGTNARARVTVADAGFLSGQLYVGYQTNASAVMVVTNDGVAWGWTGGSDPTYVGYGANAYGRLELYDNGTLNSRRNTGADNQLLIGYGGGSTGIVTMTGNAVITNVSTLTIGNQGYGSLSMGGNSSLRVSGVATLGNAAGVEGVMRVTGGAWSQVGALNIGTVAGATGRLTVADCAITGLAGAVTIGGGTDAGDRLGSVTVSNATFGAGAAVTVRTNGFVELTGTGSVFQCNTFTCRGGWVTNRVSLFSGGVDVTNTATTALAITNGGRMHLVFVSAAESGEFWGLRWAGNRKTQVDAIVADGALTWEDSAVGGGVKVFTNATHTMVGCVMMPGGTSFRFR